MKVLYNNKIGSLVPINGFYCQNCLYYPKDGSSISRCRKVGLMKLCIGVSNYYRFVLNSSDLLNYEDESK